MMGDLDSIDYAENERRLQAVYERLQGLELGAKTVRPLSYRYAERARIVQQSQAVEWGEDESVAGRRVVVSGDGGRVRLRESKRGRKTAKQRQRYRGAWREPKLLIIYVVDAKGKLEQSFAPVIDGTLRGPDAWLSLRRGYLQSLRKLIGCCLSPTERIGSGTGSGG